MWPPNLCFLLIYTVSAAALGSEQVCAVLGALTIQSHSLAGGLHIGQAECDKLYPKAPTAPFSPLPLTGLFSRKQKLQKRR